MVAEKDKCDYIYVDRYESAARILQSDKLENGESINNKPKPTVEESIEYYKELIEENKEQIELVISINDTAPESMRTAMRILVEYNEYNDYYLMLDGHPSTDSDDTARVFVYNEDYGEMLPIDEQPYSERVHWMDSPEGIAFINEHKTEEKFKYLLHMTSKKIRPFVARAADRFEILYCPPTDPTNLRDDFLSIYRMSLNYVISVFYSDAYRIPEPKLYEGFIGMAILFMAIGEMHYKYLDVDISRDFYDLDSLKIIYEAYSVPFYDIIPLKYHKKIVKNINRLLRYKGSNQVFFDLCDIFDYDILGIFQYYLFKERKLDRNNDPYVVWKTTDGKEVSYDEDGNPTNLPVDIEGKPIWEPDLQAMYEIYFVKANINKDRYTQLIDPNNKVTYDSIVNEDSYWFQFDPDTVKTIYENVYNYIETKYIGVQLMFNMTDLLWESSYFMGMLRDNRSKISNSRFMVSHDRLGTSVPLFDMLIYIIALICKKRGYTGEIRGLFYKVDDEGNYLDANGKITTDPSKYVETPTKTARILGFNFKGLLKGLQAIKDPFNQEISHREKTMQGHHIKKDFVDGENFHPFDIAIGNDFFHGDYIQDWIQKNEGFVQSDEGRKTGARLKVMQVAVGDKNARHFERITQPFNLLEDQYSMWNSLAMWDDKTVVALGEVKLENVAAPMLIQGHILSDITLKNRKIMDYPIFVGSKTEANVQVGLGIDSCSLYVKCKVIDPTPYPAMSGTQAGDGVYLLIDSRNSSLALPDKGTYKIWCSYSGEFVFWEGNCGQWMPFDFSPSVASVSHYDGYYELQLVLPAKEFGIQKGSMRIGAGISNYPDMCHEGVEWLVHSDVDKPYTWMKVNIE